MKRLPDTELEVMKALWAAGANVPRAALCWTACTAPPRTSWPPWPAAGWSRGSWRISRRCWTS